jgi:hypothetical protein
MSLVDRSFEEVCSIMDRTGEVCELLVEHATDFRMCDLLEDGGPPNSGGGGGGGFGGMAGAGGPRKSGDGAGLGLVAGKLEFSHMHELLSVSVWLVSSVSFPVSHVENGTINENETLLKL